MDWTTQATLIETQTLLTEGDLLAYKLREVLESGNHARTLQVYGSIGAATAHQMIGTIQNWTRLDRNRGRYHIALASFGEYDGNGMGHSVDTMAIVDVLNDARARGTHITIEVKGMAARQAVVLLQCADHRVINRNGWLMMTEDPYKFHSNSAEIKTEVAYRKSFESDGRILIANRSKGLVTLESIKEHTEREQEWWLTADEAVALGLADEVSCIHHPLVSIPNEFAAEWAIREDDEPSVRKTKAEFRKNYLKLQLASVQRADTEIDYIEPRVVYLFQPVMAATVAGVSNLMLQYARGGCKHIEFRLNTPGGSVHDGLALIDTIEDLKAQGIQIDIVVLGQSASMGAFILQAGSRRLMGTQSKLMLHRIARIFGGSATQIEDQEVQMHRLEQSCVPMLAARSNLTVENIMEMTEHRDVWFNAEEAKANGLIDDVWMPN